MHKLFSTTADPSAAMLYYDISYVSLSETFKLHRFSSLNSALLEVLLRCKNCYQKSDEMSNSIAMQPSVQARTQTLKEAWLWSGSAVSLRVESHQDTPHVINSLCYPDGQKSVLVQSCGGIQHNPWTFLKRTRLYTHKVSTHSFHTLIYS